MKSKRAKQTAKCLRISDDDDGEVLDTSKALLDNTAEPVNSNPTMPTSNNNQIPTTSTISISQRPSGDVSGMLLTINTILSSLPSNFDPDPVTAEDTSSSIPNDLNNFLPPIHSTASTSSNDQSTASPVSSDNISATSTNNSVSARRSCTNNRGGRRGISSVWQYAIKSDDGKLAACQLCDFTCAVVSHSTSSIRYHLIRQHNKYDLMIKTAYPPTTRSSISQQYKRDLHALCYNAIVIDHRTFNDLRKKGILAVFKKLCPGYTPPHRNQVSSQLKRMYKQQYELLKEELKTVDYLGLTLDFWSSRSSVSYLCIIGHWYNDRADFFSKILHFASFNGRHTAVNIASCIQENLTALGIYDKITAITCDGGENLVAACKKLDGHIKRIWCCTHRLHLVVTNALGFWNKEKKPDDNQTANSSKEILATAPTTASVSATSDVIHKENEQCLPTTSSIQQATVFPGDPSVDEVICDGNENDVTMANVDDDDREYEDDADSSSDDEPINDTQLLDMIYDNWATTVDTKVFPFEVVELTMNVLKKCRTIATITRKSSIIANYLRSQKATIKTTKTINNDCKSRWNSTFILIDSILETKQLLTKLFHEKKTLKLRKEQLDKLTAIELSNDDWDFLATLHHVLKPFFLGTVMMSGKNYPSIGLAYHVIHKLKHFCDIDSGEHGHVKELKQLLSSKLYHYFYYDIEQLNYLQIHGFFDPTTHLTLSDAEKAQCEKHIKNLIFNDNYPQKRLGVNSTQTPSVAVAATTSSSMPGEAQASAARAMPLKQSTYDDFIAACGEQGLLSESNKEKSIRIAMNEELKNFRSVVQDCNSKTKPSTTTAIDFWKKYYIQLPLLWSLARVHLTATGSSVPSESAFSCSAYVARKERSRLSPDNLAFSVFLKDKLDQP